MLGGLGLGGRVALGAATGGASEFSNLAAGGMLFPGGGGGGPDISGELAKISALYAAQLAAAKAANAETARQQGSQARNNLAGRGTYRSPVAEHVFGEIRRNQSSADAQAAGQLAGSEAQMRGSLLAQLLGYDQQAKGLAGQQKAALFSQGGSLLSSLLLASIMKNPAPLLATVASSGAAGATGGGGGGGGMSPMSFFGRSSASYGAPMAGG